MGEGGHLTSPCFCSFELHSGEGPHISQMGKLSWAPTGSLIEVGLDLHLLSAGQGLFCFYQHLPSCQGITS